MGNAAAEGAEKSGEIIHYLTQSTFLGEVNMQTMYMTWVTMQSSSYCSFWFVRTRKWFLPDCRMQWKSFLIS